MPSPRSRRRPVARSSQKLKTGPLVFGGCAVVLAIALFVLMGGDDPKPDESRESAASSSSTAGTPSSETVGPVVQPVETPEPEPETPRVADPPPPETATPEQLRAIRRKALTARSAREARAAALEAIGFGDEALAEECWARVIDLDPENAEAREKLDVRPLAPESDLPGFTEIAATLRRVHLQPWYDAGARDTTRLERAELVKQWEAARAELEERAEKAKTSPYFQGVDRLRSELQAEPFFADLDYQMIESVPPYALFIEVAGTPEERASRRDVAEKSYTPFLQAYDRAIREYLFPLSPKPPDPDPVFPVFVFLDRARYEEYCASRSGDKPSPSQRAHYEPWTKKSFTYSPVIKLGIGEFEHGVQVLLHEITHAWVDELASSDDGETRTIRTVDSHWFSEGIAEYLSCQFMHRGEVRFQPWRSQRIAGAYRPPGWRIGIKEALEIPSHALDMVAALKVADLAPEKRQDAIGVITSGFYADMANFILWLNLRSGGDRAAQFEAFAREELCGRGGFDAFERCVPGLLAEIPDLDATIDDFARRIANGNINPYKEFEEAKRAVPKPAGGE
jgi:hypothetical protein